MNLGLISAYATGFLTWATVAWVRRLQRPPYRMEDFAGAYKRIVAGIAQLAWRLEGAPACASEGHTLSGWARDPGSDALRHGCRLVLRDIRASTKFMLRLASQSSCDALRHSPPEDRPAIWRNLKDIHKAGQSVRRQARRAGLQLILSGFDCGACSTLKAAREHSLMCQRAGQHLEGCFGSPKKSQGSRLILVSRDGRCQ